jgi:hypothetical protein
MNRFFQQSGAWKQAGVAIQRVDKGQLNPNLFRHDKEGHFILKKCLIRML